MHDLRARHAEHGVTIGRTARPAALDLRVYRRDADVGRQTLVRADGGVDGAALEPELSEDVVEPRSLRAQQAIGEEVEAILRCDVGRRDGRHVLGVEGEVELVDTELLRSAPSARSIGRAPNARRSNARQRTDGIQMSRGAG